MFYISYFISIFVCICSILPCILSFYLTQPPRFTSFHDLPFDATIDVSPSLPGLSFVSIEREKAVEHLATHLLMIRDAEALRKKQGDHPTNKTHSHNTLALTMLTQHLHTNITHLHTNITHLHNLLTQTIRKKQGGGVVTHSSYTRTYTYITQ